MQAPVVPAGYGRKLRPGEAGIPSHRDVLEATLHCRWCLGADLSLDLHGWNGVLFVSFWIDSHDTDHQADSSLPAWKLVS